MSEHDLTDAEREAMRESQAIEHFPIGLRNPEKELTVYLTTDDPEYIRTLFGRSMICTHVEGRIVRPDKWECTLKLAPEPDDDIPEEWDGSTEVKLDAEGFAKEA